MGPGFGTITLDDEGVTFAPATERFLVFVGKVAGGHEPGLDEGLERIGHLAVGEAVGVNGAANAKTNEVGFIVGLHATGRFRREGQEPEHLDGDRPCMSRFGGQSAEAEFVGAFG